MLIFMFSLSISIVRILSFILSFLFITTHGYAQTDLRLQANYQSVHSEGLLRAVDLTLIGLSDLFSTNDRLDDLIVHESLNRHLKRIPGLRALIITDAQGRLRHDSSRYPTKPMELGSRPYIKNSFSLKENDLYIGAPIQNNIVNFNSLPISRPIIDRNGSLKGVVAALMSPEHLIQYDRICKKCFIGIYNTTGKKIASYPAITNFKPDIAKLITQYDINQNFEYEINGLKTLSLWTKQETYDLIVLYSHYQ